MWDQTADCATPCVDITGFALVLTGSKAEQTFPGAVNSPLTGCWLLGWTGLCGDVTQPGGYTGLFSRGGVGGRARRIPRNSPWQHKHSPAEHAR